MGKRTKSREYAMTLLYQWDLRRCPVDDLVREIESSDARFKGELRDFCLQLVRGVVENIDSIDEKILKCARNWTLDRMAAIDRSILRIASFEMMKTDTPCGVSINEAIELAKKFSTERSGEFVNGILDTVAASLKLK